MHDKSNEKLNQPSGATRAWEPPRLTRVGHVGDVLQTGPGKLSPVGGDTGEMRAEKPLK